jgi:regulatory protein
VPRPKASNTAGLAAVTLKAQAIRLLARREYARAEMEERLIAKGGTREEVRALVDDLVERGYLSNERYARSVVRRKTNRFSRRSISAELKMSGVDSADIDAALADTGADDDATLATLWQRRFGKPPVDERDKARQVRFLQSRGFSLSAILKLLRTPCD